MPIVICQCRVSKLPLEAMSKPKQSPRTKPAVEMQQQNDMERSTKKQRKDIIMLDHGEAVAPPKLRIFTDFSGMEAPCLALEGLGVDYLHVGACEKSPIDAEVHSQKCCTAAPLQGPGFAKYKNVYMLMSS